MMIGRSRRTVSFALAAAVTRAATVALSAAAPGGRWRWERTNHAGRTVVLYPGPAVAAAATAGAWRVHPAAGFAVLAAGACGVYDDIAGAGDPRRGFRAHLSALRDGDVTTGAVKLFGISAAALAAGAVLKERPLDKVLAGVVIAGAAHFVNLVDVRPGRAAGSVLALAAPGLLRKGACGELAAVAVGAAAAALPDDLGERAMLGDTGAHALGAALGAAAVAGNGRAGMLAHAVAFVAAAAYGDKVSEAARSWRIGQFPVAPLPPATTSPV
jgi:UDP-N-acetylmuramyl pentapeptide phosphotransferase/UDP-N-acetylglucosamine-1-phosphate transferase